MTLRVVLGLSLMLLACCSSARAETYPSRLIRVILPYTAGSPNDIIARIFAPHLSARLGQNVILDNRPGGATSIGVRAAMTATPDGYTLMFSNSSSHSIASLGSTAVKYDPVTDLEPVGAVAMNALALVVLPSVPHGSTQELVAYAHANPGKLNISFGQGTLPHLLAEMFKRAANVDITGVPYRGGPQAVSDLLAGHVHMTFGSPDRVAPLVREGRLAAVAYTGVRRSLDFPDLPTMAEAGYPQVTSAAHYGFFAPVGTPAPIIARLNAELNAILRTEEVKAELAKLSFEIVGGSSAEYRAVIAAEVPKWKEAVEAVGFTME